MPQDLSCTVSAGTIIIPLKGDFNIENRKLVVNTWETELAKNPETVIFDCRELHSIDSSAIGTLVKFLTTAMNRNIKMLLCNLGSSILEIFKLAQLDKFFTITTIGN